MDTAKFFITIGYNYNNMAFILKLAAFKLFGTFQVRMLRLLSLHELFLY